MDWAIVGVVLVAIALLALTVALRVLRLRHSGSPIIVRYGPAESDHGWRHGIITYDDETLYYYRLSSLRPGASWTMHRRELEVVGRRRPQGDEREIMHDRIVIIEASDQESTLELAFERDGLTAFLSWLESRPSPRRARS